MVPLLCVAAALSGLGLALYFSSLVHRADEGTAAMREIAAAIREGAMAFIRREYRWVAFFVAAMALLIFAMLPYGRPWGAIAYLFGAGFSASSGLIGMRVATAANSRTASAARFGAAQALPLAFRGGAVMGFTVAGLGLGGIGLAYLVFHVLLDVQDAFQVIAAFALGGSSIALFARIGGGIYTKAADVGADLVGKVEAGIPEDDPRNPATIADNVGDNVGDVAGMGADLFESYAGALVAPIVLAGLVFAEADPDLQRASFLFPLLIGALGMAASILGALSVRGRRDARLARQLHRGTNLAAILTILGTIGAAYWLFRGEVSPLHLAGTVIAGLVAGMAIGFTSEYYTSSHYRPVRELAGQSETGAATVVIGGVAEGMLSTLASVLLVVGAIGFAFYLGEQAMPAIPDAGLYGVSLAAIGMLATTGVVVSVDAYGPIADNAGGIAQMAHLPPEVREVTDSLDALGNTTAAIAKGFAIGSAAITALALFKSFTAAAALETIDIEDVDVTIGLFLGAMIPFAFAALTMKSVGRAAQRMIQEVRRQFAEIAGLREGRRGIRPDYARCVDISTRAALREMIAPGSLAVVLPLLLGFISVGALGGFLAGALVTGFLLAIFMANAGGAWDNAKKFIEAGNLGGKGSEAHKAAVVGDTVGDPFKDTSGPSMNILIKVMTIVALVFAPAFIR
ncbi:MAG: sodium-translocating pyrophosphatase [Nitriliruptorales bacterium]